jgi:ATP-dependent helicase/nuclease subunit B
MTQTDAKLYGISLGVDYPRAFVQGLVTRFADRPPEHLARAHILVNSGRMMRRIRDELVQQNATLHPQMHLVTDLTRLSGTFNVKSPKSTLALRLELVGLVTRLLDAQPDLAARSSVYALSDSLANLIDEIQSEGVDPMVIDALEVPDQSGHWARALEFLKIVQRYLSNRKLDPDTQSFLRTQIQHLVKIWQTTPINDAVIIAGSTGSRGTTMDLMRAVSKLPNGMVVLPGLDREMSSQTWARLSDPLTGQDHPQYRLAKVAEVFATDPALIPEWSNIVPVNHGRNALVSMALRPAPVTDTWRKDGPNLSDLEAATRDITWVNATTKRAEALAIALKMRQAVETGEKIALITPDRQLTRQITAALDKWDILPDDSAGTPLQLSPPGRFLRHVAGVISRPITASSLLALLKHPLTHSGGERGTHLLLTRELELFLRKSGIPFPTEPILKEWSKVHKHEDSIVWADWIGSAILSVARTGVGNFEDWVKHHKTTSIEIAAGSKPNPDTPSGELWRHKAGAQVEFLFDTLTEAASAAEPLDIRDYIDIFNGVLSQGEVRDFAQPHPNITILGTLEARVQSADTIILSGLNENTWPDPPKPDPWLNRKMRVQAGLLLPERRIGLSAHDFQTAVTLGKCVWITRSLRSEDAQTIPSRWINRLSNLLSGLDKNQGPAALNAMVARGDYWLDLVQAYDDAPKTPSAHRPSVVPPISARPNELSVTEIKTLIRDPYSIYAKRILRLRSLESLDQTPDARLRGIIIHEVMEQFCRDWDETPPERRSSHLIDLTKSALSARAPWAVTQLFWQSRMMRIADWFVEQESKRRADGTPINYEIKGRLRFDDLDFTLTAIADRIDATEGGVQIYDYKTGTPPTKKQQRYFDKQLYLLSIIAEDGGFDDLDPVVVVMASFIGLGSTPKEEPMPIADEDIETARAGFHKLMKTYADPNQGYTARRALFRVEDFSEYDQLSRFGEWDVTDTPKKDHLI